MKPEAENFETLKKLLALKRHEQPAPGYFDSLPAEISARISDLDSERADNKIRGVQVAAWVHMTWNMLSARPILAGAFSVCLTSLVLWNVLSAYNRPNETMAENPFSSSINAPTWVAGQSASTTPVALSSTNPVFGSQAPSGLFDGPRLGAQPANFTPSLNGANR